MSPDEHTEIANALLVALKGATALIRVRGRGSFKVSPAVKTFGTHAIEQGVERFVFDMRECVGMDSTFMGVLAGLAFRLRAKNGGQICMINLSSRTRGLLATLGLDQLIQPYMEGGAPQELDALFAAQTGLNELNTSAAGRQETAETVLQAHEDLVEVLPENLPRFKDVLTYLREDAERKTDPSAGEG